MVKLIMKFELGKIYHEYNRGNNKQRIYFNEENYLFFLRKVKVLLLPTCELLAYCLMPNHFHLLIYANEETVSLDERNRNKFSEAIRKMLSQYTKAVNKQENRTSSLFQQNTKAKEIPLCHDHRGIMGNAALNCFIYIHQNPLILTDNDLTAWKFSSYSDYASNKEDSLCNIQLAYSLLDFDKAEFPGILGACHDYRATIRNI